MQEHTHHYKSESNTHPTFDFMIMVKKRTYKEIDHIDDVDGPATNTTFHGAITALSPVKKGRNSIFFDGRLADNTSTMRLVGFAAAQQKKLEEYQQKKVAVELRNCEVKRSRYGEGYELMLKSGSSIKESPKKIDVSTLIADNEKSNNEITLEQLPEMALFQKVIVTVKVIKVNDTVQLPEKMKQDIIVADQTATARVTLWEDNVGAFNEGRSYILKNFVVRVYQSTKYLSMGGDATEIVPIEDIGMVAAASDINDEEEVTLHNVVIVGVPHLDTHKACLQCKARVEPLTPPLGRCSKPECKMLQRFDLCINHTTAKLLLMHETDGQNKIIQVHAFGEHLGQIVGDEESVTPEALVKAPQLRSVTILKDRKIVRAVNQD